LWGDKKSTLHEYSCRQWSGLLNGFYKKRWEQFFDVVIRQMKRGETFDQKAFDQQISTWEWNWVNSHERYPAMPAGDPVKTAENLYAKYWKRIFLAYQ
jgi:alpha-N-acetylglucosaminidase